MVGSASSLAHWLCQLVCASAWHWHLQSDASGMCTAVEPDMWQPWMGWCVLRHTVQHQVHCTCWCVQLLQLPLCLVLHCPVRLYALHWCARVDTSRGRTVAGPWPWCLQVLDAMGAEAHVAQGAPLVLA